MRYQYNDFSMISSDLDLELLCDDDEPSRFKNAVNQAINYMLDTYEAINYFIPTNLALYASLSDNVVSLRKYHHGKQLLNLSEDLQVWLDVVDEELHVNN